MKSKWEKWRKKRAWSFEEDSKENYCIKKDKIKDFKYGARILQKTWGQQLESLKRGKVFPIPTIQAYRGHTGIALPIPNIQD